MSSIEYAKAELKLVGMDPDGAPDDINAVMGRDIVAIIEKFSEQGHSGFSASFAIPRITRLMQFKPLKPLTGDDSEWAEPHESWGDGHQIQQNKRYSAVFRDMKTGKAWDIDAVAFRRGKNGPAFTKGGHRHYIKFPYMPGETKIVTIPRWQFWR